MHLTYFKMTYEKEEDLSRVFEDGLEPELDGLKERASIQVQCIRNDKNQLIVEFQRKAGSSRIFANEFKKFSKLAVDNPKTATETS